MSWIARYCLSLFFLPYFSFCLMAQTAPIQLRCMNRVDPLGIDDPHPRLSWRISSDQKDLRQTAYEIRLREDARQSSFLWETGKVISGVSIAIPYQGPPLRSGQKYFWQVRVWDSQDKPSPWSPVANWQMGLLQAEDWTARWIGPGFEEDSLRRPPPVFTRSFTLPRKIRSATLYITAHGLYEAMLNGRRVGNAYFTPGWTSYDHRLQYQVYDVKEQLHTGANQVQVTVGDGWWRGVFGGAMKNNNYGKDASLLFQLDLQYADGSRERIVSDSSWASGTGPIRYADLYNGEVLDARTSRDIHAGVSLPESPKDNLVASIAEPVTRQETFKPVKVFTDPKGETLIDFGQNLTGWVQCRLQGRPGDTITIAHAEALDKDGNFYTGNLREAKATDVYILKGGAAETFEPHFTFHGFRYIKIEGVRGVLKPADFTAITLYSDLRRTGTFSCSDTLLNQLQHNINWSQQDNFLEIPSDCPQRSERYGWTGDAQIFARTASYNRNVMNFLSKWLEDLAADQDSLGGVPVIIPDLNGHRSRGLKRSVAGWGDAATIVPWTLFRAYGDTALLRRQYPSMKAWVNNIWRMSPNYLWTAPGYGDWLAPDTMVLTPVPFISQCYFAHSTDLLVQAATVLGIYEDSAVYGALFRHVKEAFLKVWTPLPATETGYVLALDFDLLPENLRADAVEKLVASVHAHEDHLSTGFLGTPALLPVLSRYGHSDLAYTIIKQESLPSWLYPVKMGATTIWEKWDAIAPDGTVGEKSLNHYSYGAVGDWLYRVVAGISEMEPGYKKIRIAPHPGGGLSWVKASYECPYGMIVCNWRITDGRLSLHLEVPANTEAEVWLPGERGCKTVGAGSYDF